MKAFLVFLGLVLSIGTVSGADKLPAPDDPKALAQWFSSLGSRREGSGEEAAVFRALKVWFGSRTSLEEAGFTEIEGEHSFSRRLWLRVAGKAPGELVVVTPTDGANHRGLAWAVTWALDALDRGSEVSVTFLFTGAERGAGPSSGLGSRAFLQDFYPTDPAAVVYLDADDSDFRLRLTTESGLIPSPLWMVQGLTEALDAHGLDPRFTGTAPALFRLDLPERRNALAPWFERSIPGVLVASGPASVAVVRGLEDFASSLRDGLPARWDRHYLVFDFGSWKFFWDQRTYILIFLSVVATLLFGYALAGRSRRGSLRVLGTGFWQIPVLFAFLFLALYAGTGISNLLLEARGSPDFWKSAPLLVWTFKSFVAITLYLLLFLPFRRSPLSRNPDYYGQAALVWLGVTVLVSAGFELSFSFYFLWALCWCAVVVVAPWRSLRLLALAMGPAWLFKAAWDILGPQKDLALTEWVLGSPVAGNFIMAVLFFPFLLQVNAWHFSGRPHQDRDESLRAGVQLTVWGLATLLIGMAVLRVSVEDEAPRAAGPVVVDVAKTPRPELLAHRLGRSAFLDRSVWVVEFLGSSRPEALDLKLLSDQALVIYDCSFPVTLDAEGTGAKIVVGRQPPLPLSVRVTLPASTKARLEVTASFAGSPGLDAVETIELVP